MQFIGSVLGYAAYVVYAVYKVYKACALYAVHAVCAAFAVYAVCAVHLCRFSFFSKPKCGFMRFYVLTSTPLVILYI